VSKRHTSKQPHPTGSGRVRYYVKEHRGDESTRVRGRYESGSMAAGMAAMLQRLGRDLMPRGSTYYVNAHRAKPLPARDPISPRTKELVRIAVKNAKQRRQR
jgi:hypothetical protein